VKGLILVNPRDGGSADVHPRCRNYLGRIAFQLIIEAILHGFAEITRYIVIYYGSRLTPEQAMLFQKKEQLLTNRHLSLLLQVPSTWFHLQLMPIEILKSEYYIK
jgi:hypothetical protein